MATIVSTRGTAPTDDARRVDGPTLLATTGWELKPEGLCRDDACLLVPDDVRTGDGTVDAVELWARLGRPVLTAGDDVFLGEDAGTKPAANAGQPAPDFTLRDLAGIEHSLSQHRGKKVLLASWAPW